jgi:hypothetical protein
MRPTLLALIVASNIVASNAGCSDSRTVFLDGQPPGDVGTDYLGHKDVQALDNGALDIQAPDAVPYMDAAPKDAPPATDGNTGFPQALDGIWLVGWMGGLNRFSWGRFTVTSKSGGTAIINKGTLSSGTVPYWNCNGTTTWNITSKPNTIQLHYPAAQCTGMWSGSFTFKSIVPYTGTYPKGAQFVAVIQALSATPGTVSGFKFPPSQCDATMTTCKDPL